MPNTCATRYSIGNTVVLNLLRPRDQPSSSAMSSASNVILAYLVLPVTMQMSVPFNDEVYSVQVKHRFVLLAIFTEICFNLS